MQEIPQNNAPKAPNNARVQRTASPAFAQTPKAQKVASESQKRQEKILKKSKTNTFTLGIVAMAIVCGVALVFFILGFFRQGTVDTLQEEVSTLQSEIQSVKSDKNVVIANIIDKNNIESSLPLKEIISDFKKAARTANVELQGFTVQNGVITTNLISKEGSTTHSDPAITIIEMMRNYAKDENRLFDLEPITNISGTPEERTTNISFKIIERDKSENSQ